MLAILTDEKIDPRVRRTRQMLVQAFTELIHEKEFTSITVHDITDRADVNRSTFYAHFPDKFALLDYKIRQEFRAEIEKRTLNACHFSMDNLRALIVTVCEFIGDANNQCKSPRGQFEPFMEAQVKGQINELLLAWLKQTRSEISPEIVAVAASWAIYGLAQYWNRHKEHDSLNEYVEKVLPLAAANLQLSPA
jgi:AcrR family transcriptional regulator